MVLYKSGWTPLTPINVAAVGASPRARVRRPRPGPATHLAVCFIRTEADTSREPPAGEGAAAESCLCIETYRCGTILIHCYQHSASLRSFCRSLNLNVKL